jgi:polyisoprenoid-binding protein YceI
LRAMRLLKLGVAAVVAVAVLVTAGTFVFIHFIEGDAPAKLTLEADSSTTTTAGSSTATVSLDGTWAASSTGTQVGYRVKEVLFGQNATAVGRTSKVTGSLVIDGTTVSSTKVVADMTSVSSDKSQRDNQFQGRIMNTSQYPTATFELTKPIDLDSVPTVGQVVKATATGKLTLHGTTKEITTTLSAKYDGTKIAVNGSIPITFADYNIPNPTFGPVSTEDHGTLELLVYFTKG